MVDVTTQPTESLGGTTTSARAPKPGPAPQLREPDRVLVVDDDEGVRSLVRDSLEREGFEVRVVGDGTSALDELAVAVPSLVILDVNLPERGGFEVLSAIRSTWGVPVILLTGRISEID